MTAHLRELPLEPKLDGGTWMSSSSTSSSSRKENDDDAAGLLLAFGTALNAVKGGEADGGAGSAALLGGSLCVGGGRRLTTCRRDPEFGVILTIAQNMDCTFSIPPPPEPLFPPLVLVREGSNLEARDSRNLNVSEILPVLPTSWWNLSFRTFEYPRRWSMRTMGAPPPPPRPAAASPAPSPSSAPG